MTRQNIPWAEPRYWGNEATYALEALQSGWISGGPFVDRFEDDLRTYCNSPYAVATSNGTTAIHDAFLALGVKAGDDIIVPGFAFMAAANVALHIGARPIFADVDPATWCITAETIAAVITPETRGVVPVHTYGNMCDMQPILDLAAQHGLWVLEDAAEALGSTYRGAQAGTIAPIGTFSFHATKTITTGEGGGVVTRDPKLDDLLRLYRSHGVRDRRYFHDVPGHNFRLPNVMAAIGCAQFENIEMILLERRRLHRQYLEHLGSISGVIPQSMTAGVDAVVWAVGLVLDPNVFTKGRDDMMNHLATLGIETRPGFHAAGEMAHIYGPQTLPVSQGLADAVISLPSSPTVSLEEIEFITGALAEHAG